MQVHPFSLGPVFIGQSELKRHIMTLCRQTCSDWCWLKGQYQGWEHTSCCSWAGVNSAEPSVRKEKRRKPSKRLKMLLKLPFCKTVHEVHLNRQKSYHYKNPFNENKNTSTSNFASLMQKKKKKKTLISAYTIKSHLHCQIHLHSSSLLTAF